jgi:hypothetical protein
LYRNKETNMDKIEIKNTTTGETLSLTEREVALLLAGIQMQTPSGGGSALYTFYRKLCDFTDSQADLADVMAGTEVVINEAREAGVI